jgi:3-oxoadipate enol-lactonase
VFVTTDDAVRLHVVSEGSGTVPIVLSNSLGTTVDLWEGQIAALSSSHAVWRYDTRGHGRSDAPMGEYSLERLGRDLIAVVDATAAPHVDLCGVSIGGLTALWAAIHRPARVRRLVLANTAARIGDPALWSERIAAARAGGMRPLADAAMLRWFTEPFRVAQPGIVSFFRETIEQTSVDGYAGCCAALRDGDVRPQAGGVSCPTLIVTGTHDVATPAEAGRWLGDQIGGAHVVELAAAHLSNVECAEQFNAAVRAFLAAA